METDILILQVGSVGTTAFTSVWRYNVASDSFESLPDLKLAARSSGSDGLSASLWPRW